MEGGAEQGVGQRHQAPVDQGSCQHAAALPRPPQSTHALSELSGVPPQRRRQARGAMPTRHPLQAARPPSDKAQGSEEQQADRRPRGDQGAGPHRPLQIHQRQRHRGQCQQDDAVEQRLHQHAAAHRRVAQLRAAAEEVDPRYQAGLDGQEVVGRYAQRESVQRRPVAAIGEVSEQIAPACRSHNVGREVGAGGGQHQRRVGRGEGVPHGVEILPREEEGEAAAGDGEQQPEPRRP